MKYHWQNGSEINLPIGKAVCVGRNYVAHAHELGNEVPSEPLLFIKPNTSICNALDSVSLNSNLGEHHYEVELTLLIGKPLNKDNIDDYMSCIAGVGVGLDLTLRDLQSKLKAKGQPWEKAKAYDKSCVVSSFVAANDVDLTASTFKLTINEQQRQLGDTRLMLFDIESLLTEIVQYFSLQPGDLVLTGTPEGVGKLNPADYLEMSLNDVKLASFSIA